MSAAATPPNKNQVIDGCKAVLEQNQRDGGFTAPAEGLYPHQWLWDSCFIAIGLAEYDVPRAQTELRNLLRGQWSNGMIPHMIFADGDEHKRDRNIWQSWRNPHAPDGLATSGLTQPPMLAEAVVRVGAKLTLTERRSWYQDMYPALTAYHRWIYAERDPHNEGLALLIHPWESGLDNSPPWIEQLHQHSRPWWVSAIDVLKLDSAVRFLRRDTKHVPPGQRIDDIDAILYFTIIQRFRRKNWDINRILSRSIFSFIDLPFNCILIRANQHLQDIAKTIGRTLPEDLARSIEKSNSALDTLWDGYSSQYYSQTFITHSPDATPTIGTLLPLYAGTITPERAKELVAMLTDPAQFGGAYPVPSVPFNSRWYKELGYWQGPTWINTNWLIADGLRRYGYDTEARAVEQASIDVVTKHGPYEYFSAKNGVPAGARNFSWTAALIIDMLKRR